jgi:predicted  nucleic acid-binding Zn-ribbon protein
MRRAKRLWLWHEAKEQVNAERAEKLRWEQERQLLADHVRQLEAKLALLPAPVTTDEEISKLLLEQELWTARKDWERLVEQSEERLAELEQSIRQREFAILQLEQELDEEDVRQYHRLAENKARPLAEVRNKSCMGCFLPLSLSKLDEWRRAKGLVYCDECGRILV